MGEYDFPFNSFTSKDDLTADLCTRGENDFPFSWIGLKDGNKVIAA
jgi:hypothetical protein